MEGMLDVLWDNDTTPRAIPMYTLIFCRYVGFKGGAQATNRIVGKDALAAHLSEIGFTQQSSKHWLARLDSEGEVSINNVSMPEKLLPIYTN